eukprot:gnl/TRDRNA2_/TRDRNA2_152647_c0_seq2.p1 gnl/TRDRNA2_/TRDRNA2_152647_c0~~gnl/TRDRNA2_/TRDRNA2_152647_c0_seq2.p1  ORF type:complete len:628 (+),score=107.09 gnl/TRDRNA2_/TRDRNA2_152647_c0_seq2:102-1985(+)
MAGRSTSSILAMTSIGGFVCDVAAASWLRMPPASFELQDKVTLPALPSEEIVDYLSDASRCLVASRYASCSLDEGSTKSEVVRAPLLELLFDQDFKFNGHKSGNESVQEHDFDEIEKEAERRLYYREAAYEAASTALSGSRRETGSYPGPRRTSNYYACLHSCTMDYCVTSEVAEIIGEYNDAFEALFACKVEQRQLCRDYWKENELGRDKCLASGCKRERSRFRKARVGKEAPYIVQALLAAGDCRREVCKPHCKTDVAGVPVRPPPVRAPPPPAPPPPPGPAPPPPAPTSPAPVPTGVVVPPPVLPQETAMSHMRGVYGHMEEASGGQMPLVAPGVLTAPSTVGVPLGMMPEPQQYWIDSHPPQAESHIKARTLMVGNSRSILPDRKGLRNRKVPKHSRDGSDLPAFSVPDEFSAKKPGDGDSKEESQCKSVSTGPSSDEEAVVEAGKSAKGKGKQGRGHKGRRGGNRIAASADNSRYMMAAQPGFQLDASAMPYVPRSTGAALERAPQTVAPLGGGRDAAGLEGDLLAGCPSALSAFNDKHIFIDEGEVVIDPLVDMDMKPSIGASMNEQLSDGLLQQELASPIGEPAAAVSANKAKPHKLVNARLATTRTDTASAATEVSEQH